MSHCQTRLKNSQPMSIGSRDMDIWFNSPEVERTVKFLRRRLLDVGSTVLAGLDP